MLPQFVTTLNSRKKCSVELKPKNDRKYDLPFRKVYKSKFTQKLFDVVAIATRKPPTFTIKDDQDEILRGVVYQKELIKVL